LYTSAEENYLKAILTIQLGTKNKVSTNSIAVELGTSPASVSDMLKKLLDKKLIKYQKYKGVSLSRKGKAKAVSVLRKHRLWETFLVEKLKFNWSEVHNIAEQLEHIRSEELIDRLDSFLGYPAFDPHGEPIPDKNGEMPITDTILLSSVPINLSVKVMGVNTDNRIFLEYLDRLKIRIGSIIKILSKIDFDESIQVLINKKKYQISNKTASHILVKKI
jgi:DtxR family Mn-dependent transcriptional regulator|tara:strand:+ start:784 stop:1440 length:657 start_codon:yes stop_codon:yes gene_type:complete